MNSGHRIVTLCACRPGVWAGVARETRTWVKSGFVKVRRIWNGILGLMISIICEMGCVMVVVVVVGCVKGIAGKGEMVIRGM